MASFRSQLNRAYDKKVLGRLEKTIRAIALIVDAELVRTTPVDKGRARANWLPSLNVPDNRMIDGPASNKPSIKPTLNSFKLSDTILITNNLPYIRSLNDGSSQQAPAGFVDMALEKGKRAVK